MVGTLYTSWALKASVADRLLEEGKEEKEMGTAKLESGGENSSCSVHVRGPGPGTW